MELHVSATSRIKIVCVCVCVGNRNIFLFIQTAIRRIYLHHVYGIPFIWLFNGTLCILKSFSKWVKFKLFENLIATAQMIIKLGYFIFRSSICSSLIRIYPKFWMPNFNRHSDIIRNNICTHYTTLTQRLWGQRIYRRKNFWFILYKFYLKMSLLHTRSVR